jgi:hypothetical protein
MEPARIDITMETTKTAVKQREVAEPKLRRSCHFSE